MDKIMGLVQRLAIFLVISSGFLSECSSAAGDDSGYFLFTPPFGGDRQPQEVTATKRIDNGINDASPRATLNRAETLWVGSHKIDWTPLPFFQKFIDHHQQKQQKRLEAQARKFDAQDQKGPFHIDGGMFKNSFGLPPPSQKKTFFSNPHHDFSNKFSSGGFFAGLEAAFGKKKATQPKFEQRSFIQPERDFTFSPGEPLDQPSRGTPTTPLPYSEIQSSTGGTILVSPPGTIFALSTPGPSISPIIDRLRKMTQWSKQSQKGGILKKEGKPDNVHGKRLRLKKRLRTEGKQHKHNIESIILSNDDDDDDNVNNSAERKNPQIEKSVNNIPFVSTSKSSKEESGKVNKEEISSMKSQTVLQPPADLVVLHPTNAALLNEPLQVQQSALKTYQIKRKDKKMRIFKSEQEPVISRPAITRFRFGAEDAKVNPYL